MFDAATDIRDRAKSDAADAFDEGVSNRAIAVGLGLYKGEIMKIAVVAWGSLVWEPRGQTAARFAPNGPLLPVEFCRVSGGGRLTLVIDETFGDVCRTYSAPGALNDLDAAIENLRRREETNTRDIGFTEPASGRQSESATQRHPQVLATISAWTELNGYDAAILDRVAEQLRRARGRAASRFPSQRRSAISKR